MTAARLHRCPACGTEVSAAGFLARDWALGAAPGEFAYRRCLRCHSVFQAPPPDDALLAQAYAGDYANYDAEPGLVERLAEPLAQREARRLIARCDATAPLLDLGCGTGRFLERLGRAGWTGPRRGIEYSPAVAAATSQRLGIPVTPGAAEDADLGERTLGTLVMRHVIEHLRDPGGVLARAHSALVPGGVLYLATPDVHALSAAAFGRYWWGYEVPRHITVFSPDGLRGLAREYGFEVEAEWWSFAPQMWNASLFVLLDRGRGRRWTKPATHLLNPLVTGPAIGLAALEVSVRRSTMYALVARAR